MMVVQHLIRNHHYYNVMVKSAFKRSIMRMVVQHLIRNHHYYNVMVKSALKRSIMR